MAMSSNLLPSRDLLLAMAEPPDGSISSTIALVIIKHYLEL